MLPPRNDPFGAELRRLADNLDRERIRAVGEGLGIGSVRSVGKERLRYEEHAAQESLQKLERIPTRPNDELDFLYTEFLNPIEELDPARALAVPEFLVQSPRKQKLFRSVLSHVIDLVVVIGAMVLALTVVGLFVAPSVHGSKVVGLMHWHPMRLVLQMHLFKFLFLVYFLFACYWGLFRLLVGQTIGGVCTRLGQNLSVPAA